MTYWTPTGEAETRPQTQIMWKCGLVGYARDAHRKTETDQL